MKLLGVGILCAMFLVGCVPPSAVKGYVVGQESRASMGSTMISWSPKGTINPNNFQGEQVRKELVYSGVSGTTLKLSYKEYYETAGSSLARQPFYQELTYDIATDKEINYQDMRILILSADSKGIVYKVLSEPSEMQSSQPAEGK